jgi:tetratricopeptide (TPR) repeat protein
LTKVKRGPDHPDTLINRINLAEAYDSAGRKDEAIALLREVVPAAAKVFGTGHPNTIRCTNRLCRLYEQAGRWADVESLYHESLAAFEAKQPEHWGTFQARSLRGACLAGLQKYAEAEPLIVSGYEGMRSREAKIPQRDRPRLAEAAARVARLYEGLGQAGEGRGVAEEAGTRGPACGPVPALIYSRCTGIDRTVNAASDRAASRYHYAAALRVGLT